MLNTTVIEKKACNKIQDAYFCQRFQKYLLKKIP